jgi:hypothetical protein
MKNPPVFPPAGFLSLVSDTAEQHQDNDQAERNAQQPKQNRHDDLLRMS